MKNKKRILIKLSWEAFLWKADFWFDYKKVEYFAKEIIKVSKKAEVAVVLWAWNLWRFRDNQDSWLDRVRSDSMWMMATLMNAVMLSEQINRLWKKSVVYSAETVSVSNLAKKHNPIEMREELSSWKIVFCAWGTWSPFFTTDSAAALRAAELNCDTILKATKVDWIYDSDPNKNPNAKKFETLTFNNCLEKNLKIMDSSAFAIAQEASIEIFIFKMDEEWNFEKATNWDYSVWTLVKK